MRVLGKEGLREMGAAGHHCCSKQKVKRGLWSPEEDDKLIKHITTHGHGCWSSVPKLAGISLFYFYFNLFIYWIVLVSFLII